VAAADTVYRLRLLRTEPSQVASHAAIVPASNYSGLPTPFGNDLLYEAMGAEGYVIRQSGAAGTRDFSFDGDAFHPSATADASSFYFELVSSRCSRIARVGAPGREVSIVVGPEWNSREPVVSPDGSRLAFVSAGVLYLWEGGRPSRLASVGISTPAFFPDGRRIAFTQGPPGHRTIAAVSISGGETVPLVSTGDCAEPSVSPNGRSLAFACEETGAKNIWIQDLTSGLSHRLTAAHCYNLTPTWTRDSRFVIFASDCSRGLGLTALYRIAAD
jgi:Tol biopolymer transport system component